MVKKVHFTNKVQKFITYTNKEYDRTCIDHVLYRKAYKQISNEEMNSLYICLDLYKLYEMPVHKESIHNILFHSKK